MRVMKKDGQRSDKESMTYSMEIDNDSCFRVIPQQLLAGCSLELVDNLSARRTHG
jgi:hypothetical protein